MELCKVAEVLKEMVEVDSIGIGSTMTDDQIEAIKTAQRIAENPYKINCWGCIWMTDKDMEDLEGWCSFYDSKTRGDVGPCARYRMREDV